MATKLWSTAQKGTYSGATAYVIGDFVTYNGSSYTCIANTTGNLPTNTTYWALIASKGDTGATGSTGSTGATGASGADGLDVTWRGAYSGVTAYVVNDAVSYNGSSYICILASTGNLPTNATYWDLMASKGDTGAGTGDMLKATYDTDNDGVVDNSEQLNGQAPSYYLSTDNHTNGTTNKVFTATEKTKLGHITITQAVDLDALETAVAELDQATILKGSWDASAGTFPGGGVAQAGWSYIVSVAGTVDSVSFAVNDRIIAILDNASTTTFASDWFKADYTDQVLSVAGNTGAVTQDQITGLASTGIIKRTGANTLAVATAGTDYVTPTGTETLSNKTLTAPKLADLGFIADANGNELIIGDTVASAVNEITVANAATAGAPQISATGGDTNIDLKLTAKGTGAINPTTKVKFDKTAYFAEIDNGNSSTADTIDWTAGNKQKSTLTGNCTFTFTAPSGPCSLILKLVQDATGSRTVTWPTAVHWPGGTAPTLTTTANKVDIISFYFDGSVYYGNYSLNFTA